MPKFCEQEKIIIRNRLQSEGQRLFSTLGLKKVTVDDLVNAANISKGSFYAFYQSKEQLFAEINFEIQSRLYADLFRELESEIKQKHIWASKDLVKRAIQLTIERFLQQPILSQLDQSTWDCVKRKLPQEVIEQHTFDDSLMLKKLEDYGVQFAYPYDIAVKAIHIIFAYVGEVKKHDAVLDILITGIVNQIVDN